MANKDPIGESMWGQANPNGLHRYGSDAHLAAMREQARQDEANRARNFRASRGRQGGARQSRGGFGSLLVMAIVGFFIWNGVKNNDAPPAPRTPAVQMVARTPPLAMRNNAPDVNPAPAHAAGPSPIEQEHLKYQGAHLQEWEAQLGPVRVQQIFDGLPDRSLGGLPEFANRVESAVKALHQ